MVFRKTLYGICLTAVVALTWLEIGVPGLNGTSPGLDVTPGRAHIPMILHQKHGKNNVTSSNWSGYAVTGPSGSVSEVRGSWIVPSIKNASADGTTCPGPNQYSSFWIGIDGYSSSTVEQIGTDSDCVNGHPAYYVWYEFYPHWSYTVNSVPVKPNDVISAKVTAGGKGTFTVSITNVTTGVSASINGKMNNADRSSAEWIVEAPWSGGVLPLANFGSVSFGSQSTGVASTSTATIGNSILKPIGFFTNNFVAIDMVAKDGVTLKDRTSSLSTNDGGTSFSVIYLDPGP